MRVLAFIYSFPPFHGGSGMGAHDLLKRLAELEGYRIKVVTFNYGHSVPDIGELDGMTVYRLSQWEFAHIYPIPKPTFRNLRLLWKAVHPKPDTVYTRTRFFTTTLLGLFVSFMLKISMLHTEPGSSFIQHEKPLVARIARVWDATIGKIVMARGVCIAVSGASAKFCRDSLGARKVRIIRNGVDKSVFYPIQHAPSGKLRIIYAGRLMWTKGADILSEVAERLDDHAEIVAAGEGPYALSDKIKILGHLSPQELATEMRKSDVLILPSRMEGLSRVIQEAQCCNLPVIAADVGGNRELVTHGQTGLLVKPDADNFLSAIRSLTAPTILNMREATKQAVSDYDWGMTVHDYDRVFRAVTRRQVE